MSLQGLLLIAISVEDMDLCIIQSNHNILRCKMQTRHHALILRDMPGNILASGLPRRLYQISLLEMALV
jgi:hypothetical protein